MFESKVPFLRLATEKDDMGGRGPSMVMTPSRSSFVFIAVCGTQDFCCVSQATVFIGRSKKVFRLIPMGEEEDWKEDVYWHGFPPAPS